MLNDLATLLRHNTTKRLPNPGLTNKYDPATGVLTDPPTLICIKHNGDEKPEDCTVS